MNPFPLIFITLVIAATISVPVSHCRIMQLKGTNLIEETCKQTPHHDLCIHYLKSDPQSSKKDVTGLALIMINTMKTQANNALDKIHHLLLQGSSEPALKQALNECAGRYRAIVEADVAQANAGLQKGDPKFAENGANDAAIEATSCEKSFEGKKSPLTNDNNAMHDVADITAAIVRLLL